MYVKAFAKVSPSFVLLAAIFGGCGESSTREPIPTSDSGVVDTADGSVVVVDDAGNVVDVGQVGDAGVIADASELGDAGGSADLGQVSDAAVAADLGQVADLGLEADIGVVTIQLPTPREVVAGNFATSLVCGKCHANRSGAQAMRDDQDRPVAPFDRWQATMMANASRDPYWRAVVAAEMEATPSIADEIQAICMRCHAPLLSETAAQQGTPVVELSLLEEDTAYGQLGNDGVSCTLCHQVRPDELGEESSFTGGFVVDPGKKIYGPHANPLAAPMTNGSGGFTPVEGGHMRDSGLCATCHTLAAETFYPDGRPTGVPFPEQTPYLEWRNSVFSTERAVPSAEAASCQQCHAPRDSVDGTPISTAIATRQDGTDFPLQAVPERSPYGRHIFVGGNTLLPEIIRDNAGELQSTANSAAFNELIQRVRDQLQRTTAKVSISNSGRVGELITVDVLVENMAGHKLPTGYPSRRVWVRVLVRNSSNQVVFSSGAFDAEGRLVDGSGKVLASEIVGGPVLPHYQVVRASGEAQVYEAILQDPEGDPTFHLLHSVAYAKDNRLLPRGWDTAAADARVLPVGVTGDSNFLGGRDQVRYEIPVSSAAGPHKVEVALFFQAISARELSELFQSRAPEVLRFRRMLEASSRPSELISTAMATVP